MGRPKFMSDVLLIGLGLKYNLQNSLYEINKNIYCEFKKNLLNACIGKRQVYCIMLTLF